MLGGRAQGFIRVSASTPHDKEALKHFRSGIVCIYMQGKLPTGLLVVIFFQCGIGIGRCSSWSSEVLLDSTV